MNANLVFRELQCGDFRLHARFLNQVLQFLVFGVRDAIPDRKQAIDGNRIQPFHSDMVSRQTGAVRDTPWCFAPPSYRDFRGAAMFKREHFAAMQAFPAYSESNWEIRSR